MKNIFSALFSKSVDKASSESVQSESNFLPNTKVFYDEEFAKKFIANGGVFHYCENDDIANDFLYKIIKSNAFENVLCLNNKFNNVFKSLNLVYSNSKTNADVLFIECEGLIAFDGSILISSNQIGFYKLHELPENIIVWSDINQIFRNSSEGLQQMRKKYEDKIPSNITSLRGKQTDEITNNAISKNIFLILREI